MSLFSKNISRAQITLFSITLFISAALMFDLQPMVGKMLLPIVGGTPSGWIVAMAFFQLMLLAGYFVAYALSRFEPRTHGLLYLLCLGIGAFFLPVMLSRHVGLIGPSPMEFDVFLLLTAVVAVPFIALSATASTLQRLFTTTGHAASGDPYFLYAASNLGSFAGLLLYPFYIEPRSTLTAQSHGWFIGYAILIVMAALCIMISRKEAPALKSDEKISAPPGWKKRVEWISLSFIPSALLLAVTTHITTDIFSAPLLWVLPLGIYLLTFVIAFSRKTVVSYGLILNMQPVAVAVTIALTTIVSMSAMLSWYTLIADIAAFAIIALMCHMRLARSRPVEDHQHLAEFYMMIALGGALGGILNAFIAPLIFDRLVEYPLLILASSLLNENIRSKFSSGYVHAFIGGAVLIIIFSLLYDPAKDTDALRDIFTVLVFVLPTLHPRMSLIGGAAAFLAVSIHIMQYPPVLSERNFYGVVKVYDQQIPAYENKPLLTARYLQHGTTLHGYQIMDGEYETVPTTYYTKEGPLGDIIRIMNPKNVAAVGLGTGTINCYATPDRYITFFEIDPAIAKVAKEKFTYLSKCGPRMPRIIMGDARLELKKLENEKFDMIILDAFSSDMVPTHLLTKEAIEVYLQRLNPGGVILFHISNRYFHLAEPIAAEGKLLGLKNSDVVQDKLLSFYAAPSRWIALARQDVDLGALAWTNWKPYAPQPETRPWTDDYTNIISTLNF